MIDYRYSTAAKAHKCEGFQCISGGTIEPGTKYVTEVVAPWTRIQDDPEGPGEALGEWVTRKFHTECDPRAY